MLDDFCCLVSKDGYYGTLTSQRSKAHASDDLCLISTELTFKNASQKRLDDCFFTLAAPPSTTVLECSMHVGKEVFRGVVMEVGAAKEAFAAAKRNNVHAALVETQSADRFVIAVASLKVGEVAVIHVTYAITLRRVTSVDGARHGFAFFQSIAKGRYGDVMAVGLAPCLFEFKLHLHAAHGFESIEPPAEDSEFFTVEHEDGATDAVITVASTDKKPTGSFGVTYYVKQPFASSAHCEVSAVDPTHVALRITLGAPDKATLLEAASEDPLEVIFVYDCSGSMVNTFINKETLLAVSGRAIKMAAASLSDKALVNVVIFSDTCTVLFPKGSVSIASAENAAAFMTFVEKPPINNGGTQMLHALQTASAIPPPPEQKEEECAYRRNVVVITDGDVYNDATCASVARDACEANATTRHHVIGMGADVGRALCEGVATAGRGTHVIIADVARIDEATAELMRNVTQSCHINWHVDYGVFGAACAVRQTPAVLPPTYAHTPQTIHAFVTLPEGQRVPVAGDIVTISCNLRGEPIVFRVPLSMGNAGPAGGATTHQLVAAAFIRELETSSCNDANLAEIVKLSVAHGVSSAHTAWLMRAEEPSHLAEELSTRGAHTPCEFAVVSKGGLSRGGSSPTYGTYGGDDDDDAAVASSSSRGASRGGSSPSYSPSSPCYDSDSDGDEVPKKRGRKGRKRSLDMDMERAPRAKKGGSTSVPIFTEALICALIDAYLQHKWSAESMRTTLRAFPALAKLVQGALGDGVPATDEDGVALAVAILRAGFARETKRWEVLAAKAGRVSAAIDGLAVKWADLLAGKGVDGDVVMGGSV
jgi:hypothetical protein